MFSFNNVSFSSAKVVRKREVSYFSSSCVVTWKERRKEKPWTVWGWFCNEMLWEKLIMQYGGCAFLEHICKTWSNSTTIAKEIAQVTRFIFHNLKKKNFNILSKQI